MSRFGVAMALLAAGVLGCEPAQDPGPGGEGTGADDDAVSDDDTTPSDDDATSADDDSAPTDDDSTPSDDDSTPSDDDATEPSGDDDSTPDPGDDDATEPSGDDDSTPDPGDDDTTPADVPVVRFAALGDTGEGNDDQYLVSEAMKQVCDARGCDFVMLTGDNIYDSGVDSPTDSDWDTLFEIPYAAFDIPFHPVLGNHDYGLDGLGLEAWKGQYAVDHTDYSTIWVMPDEHYTFTYAHVDFFALDTTQAFWYLAADQTAEMQAAIAASTATWKVAYGHHPYLSNGPHGDAGNYEGLWFVPIANGAGVKDMLDAAVCGQVDLYVCGHDHLRQWMTETCAGTELIVSGAGAKTTELEGEHPTEFESEVEGFFWFEIEGEVMTVATYDKYGTLEHEDVRVK